MHLAAALLTSGIEVATEHHQKETVTRTGWWADFMNKKSNLYSFTK
jgi:hypothetical protein